MTLVVEQKWPPVVPGLAVAGHNADSGTCTRGQLVKQDRYHAWSHVVRVASSLGSLSPYAEEEEERELEKRENTSATCYPRPTRESLGLC